VYENPLEHFRFEQFAAMRNPDIVRRALAGEDIDDYQTSATPPVSR